MLIDSVGFEVNSEGNVIDGCFADTAKIGCLIRGKDNIITNCGFHNNKLMGLRNTMAVKNESAALVVTNCFFTNATGTDLYYEGDSDKVSWGNNSVTKELAISAK